MPTGSHEAYKSARTLIKTNVESLLKSRMQDAGFTAPQITAAFAQVQDALALDLDEQADTLLSEFARIRQMLVKRYSLKILHPPSAPPEDPIP